MLAKTSDEQILHRGGRRQGGECLAILGITPLGVDSKFFGKTYRLSDSFFKTKGLKKAPTPKGEVIPRITRTSKRPTQFGSRALKDPDGLFSIGNR